MESVLQYNNIASCANSSFRNLFVHTSDYLNCLEPLLAELEWDGDKDIIAELLPHFTEILDLPNFLKVLKELHYDAQELTINLSDLDERLYPCIFVPDHGKAMVIKNKMGGRIQIFDGDTNAHATVSGQDMHGTVYVFKREKTDNRIDKVGWLKILFNKYRSLFKQVILVTLMLNIVALATPLFIKAVYDRVIGTESISMLASFGIGISIALIGTLALINVRSRIMAYVGTKLDEIVGSGIFKHIISLPTPYIEGVPVGTQVARIKSFDTIREFFTGSLITLVLEVPFVVIYILVVAMLGGSVALVPIAMICIYVIMALLMKKKVNQTVKASVSAGSKRQAYLIETLNNQRSIKMNGSEDTFVTRYKDICSEACIANYRSSVLTTVITSISDSLVIVAAMGILLTCIVKVIAAEMTVGAMIAIMMLLWRILTPIKSVFNSLTRLSQIRSSVEQVNNLMAIELECNSDTALHTAKLSDNDIVFSRISLRYRPDMESVLLGLDCGFARGTFTAIAGINGSGKSSVLKLIMRLYSPQNGAVLIGGKDVRQIDVKELRESIGYVPQVCQFFYGTITQNLRLANAIASQEMIENISKQLGIYDEIMDLDEGFETRIGDHTKNILSPSLQRALCIARALLKNPTILLLDEPCGDLDPHHKQALFNLIETMQGKITIILISHDKSYLQRADQIMYIENGQIAAKGSYEEVFSSLPKEIQ